MKRIVCLALLFLMTSTALMAQTDVDTLIYVSDQQDQSTFVVIIANEHYKHEQPVPYALNDGEVFKLYCNKTLGVPNDHIHYVADATLNDMCMELDWLQNAMETHSNARAIFYYSGHGMPDDDNPQSYLLPVDGYSIRATSGLSTKRLYEKLAAMPSKGTLVLLDACFSGARRDGAMLSSSRGVAIKAKEDEIKGNMIVFAASQAGQTAYPYNEKQHGLFTYSILKHLKEEGGCISLGELHDGVKSFVEQQSVIKNSKRQTPSLVASAEAHDWNKWMLSDKRASKLVRIKRSTPHPQKPETPKEPTIEVIEQPVYPVATTSKATSVYAQAFFQAGTLMGAGASIGGYISQFNIEASYVLGIAKSDDIYWVSNNNSQKPQGGAYKATAMSLRVGYGLPIAVWMRLTPQVGIGSTAISCSETATKGYALTATAGVRAEAFLTPNVAVFAAPEASFGVSKSDVFSQVADVSSKVKGWADGFNARIGLCVLF